MTALYKQGAVVVFNMTVSFTGLVNEECKYIWYLNHAAYTAIIFSTSSDAVLSASSTKTSEWSLS